MRMDEILIEEKKYVSSKRAAKITGYAKDYIGQLCREGRVPARLVGRSWYVLESAIQDHRFGTQDSESKVEVEQPEEKKWEFPRYESSPTEVLPSVLNFEKKVETTTLSIEEEPAEATLDATQDIRDSWRAWFDHVADSAAPVEVPVQSSNELEIEREEQEEEILGVEMEEDEINVPLRVVNRYEEPASVVPSVEERVAPRSPRRRNGNGMIARSIQTIGVLAAVAAFSLASLGSGYFDEYVISNAQASIISGISVYNK